MVEIYQFASALPTSGTYYRIINDAVQTGISISKLVSVVKYAPLEDGSMGLRRNIQLAQSQIGFTPQLNDYIKVNGQGYQIKSAPLYNINPVIAPYYNLEVKTVNVALT